MTYSAKAVVTIEPSASAAPVKQYEIENIRALVRSKRLIVTLPAVHGEDNCPQIFHDIQRLLDISPPGMDWVVDLSQQRALPLPLIRLFASMADEFRDQGRSFILVGAPPGLLPPEDYALHPFTTEI